MIQFVKNFLVSLVLANGATLAFAASVQVQVLDKDGRAVPDAVVLLYPAAVQAALTPSAVTIEQKRMGFLPLVTVVTPGSTVRFTNVDRWDHHVRGTSSANPLSNAPSPTDFELRLDGIAEGKPASSENITVTQPGAVLLGCHLHSSMRGHLFVADTAYSFVTDENGIARLESVPAGIAKLRVWHPEQLVELPQRPLTIGNDPLMETVTLTVVPRRRR